MSEGQLLAAVHTPNNNHTQKCLKQIEVTSHVNEWLLSQLIALSWYEGQLTDPFLVLIYTLICMLLTLISCGTTFQKQAVTIKQI